MTGAAKLAISVPTTTERQEIVLLAIGVTVS